MNCTFSSSCEINIADAVNINYIVPTLENETVLEMTVSEFCENIMFYLKLLFRSKGVYIISVPFLSSTSHLKRASGLSCHFSPARSSAFKR